MNDPHKTVIQEFLTGGWVYMLIGVAAMIARLLTVAEKSSIFQQLKKVFVGSTPATRSNDLKLTNKQGVC